MLKGMKQLSYALSLSVGSLLVLAISPLACSSEESQPGPTVTQTHTDTSTAGGGGSTSSGGSSSGGGASSGGSTSGGGGGTGGAGGSVTTGGNGGNGGTSGTGGSSAFPDPSSISGALPWTIDFDTTAETNGSTDCSLTIDYQGVEDRTVHYLCPECETIYQVSYTVDPADQSCADQIGLDSTGHLGFGGGRLYAHGKNNHRLHAVADATYDGGSQQLTVSGTGASYKYGLLEADQRRFTSTINGTLSISASTHDPLFGMIPPTTYSCGYTKSGLPAYQGSWELTDTDIPDGLFLDSCGETVRLHDIVGLGYAVIEASAVYCGPCQNWATQEPAFHTQMTNLGVEFTVITLLVEHTTGPFDVLGLTPLQDWDTQFQLSGPILADRGYGHNVVGPYVQFVKNGIDPNDYRYTQYPTWVLVNPSLNVLGVGIGCCPWSTIENLIKTDAGIP